MEGKSLNIAEEKLNKLKEILPEAFAEGKIDWEKLKAALGDEIEFKNERYVLNWAGKSDAFWVLQSPTTATLVPCKEESVDFDDTENIFIEGENLEVLKVLQKSYFGKIKMIYIDPPYNTGNDKFIYPDKFSETKEEYLSRIGDKDETGYMTREGLFRKNSKDSGYYHSNWLSMMYPRLFLARNLLREDGVIFVSIDDNEVHNLRLMMNEIFGEENFAGAISRTTKKGGNAGKYFSPSIDYVLVYTKNTEKCSPFREEASDDLIRSYNLSDEEGPYKWRNWYDSSLTLERSRNARYSIQAPDGTEIWPPDGQRWRNVEETFLERKSKGKIEFRKQDSLHINSVGAPAGWGVYYKLRPKKALTEGTVPDNVIDTAINSLGTQCLTNLGIPFDFSEPVELITKIGQFVWKTDDVILDFFAGSGTTGHAVLDQNINGGNHKFILVQLPEKCDVNSEAYKAGYKTIAEIGKERIRCVIKKIKSDKQSKLDIDENAGKQDLGFKVFKLQKSNFKIWRSDVNNEEELNAQLEQFTDPVNEKAKIENILYELLLKSGVPLTAKIEEKDNYYLANDGEIALILMKVDESIIKDVIYIKPKKVITLDRLFKDNDQLKTNTALHMKDAEIDFRVV